MFEPFEKVVRLGRKSPYEGSRRRDFFAKIRWDGKRLSISGVEGPLPSGNCYGGCGQILDDILPMDLLAPGWTQAKLHSFVGIWKRWHLNDLRAECEHQRDLCWTYSTHAGEMCPVCGYGIGTQWLVEEVPDHVLQYLHDLPDSDKKPAWV